VTGTYPVTKFRMWLLCYRARWLCLSHLMLIPGLGKVSQEIKQHCCWGWKFVLKNSKLQ